MSGRYYLCDTPGILDFVSQSTGISARGGIVMLIAHNMIHGGSAGMEYVADRTSFSVSTVEPKFAKTVWHECVGHSIGWLADEYVSSENALLEIPQETKDYMVWTITVMTIAATWLSRTIRPRYGGPISSVTNVMPTRR